MKKKEKEEEEKRREGEGEEEEERKRGSTPGILKIYLCREPGRPGMNEDKSFSTEYPIFKRQKWLSPGQTGKYASHF